MQARVAPGAGCDEAPLLRVINCTFTDELVDATVKHEARFCLRGSVTSAGTHARRHVTATLAASDDRFGQEAVRSCEVLADVTSRPNLQWG